ncbi:MAG: DnaJ domain-containing protein [Hyphomicrobiaceae bacterium]|nr:DnaJ domain-containing protein [Hyphomicrobiaceae bacterium]
MAEDPYALLGVPKNASDDDIRRAFRKLAKELHPDLNPGDRVAVERFKKVSAAYELLGDPEKRKRYDRGEIDAAGEPRRAYQQQGAAGGPFGWRGARPGGVGPETEDPGFSDIFSEIFGGARGARGARFGAGIRGGDVRYTLEIDFLEAVAGARKRVTMPEGGMLDLTVPEGVTDGQVLRLKGKGGPGFRGGEPGDALVEIKVKPHPQFKRAGDDITIELPISLDEAVLGAKIEVPTVSGRVQLTIPKGTSSGRVFRLRGKGVRNVATGATGDQLVTVRIVLPDAVDDSLAYFMSEWRQRHAYNPRERG